MITFRLHVFGTDYVVVVEDDTQGYTDPMPLTEACAVLEEMAKARAGHA